ncbi:FKBP-type peptidyl prolyl cis-trans isomerase /Apo-metallochaperone SlyD [Nitrosomonas cryotolerans]|uniref:peptidylprolyl isomerase n=1 Tax=Nitrosomonas cryotolerans ATCC 49181 TaxID=1131553 RepID=A0A1N6FC73_9PROT|nr:peptidylprolyl isomerase [Nitrosomonas cryotolerans]SFP75450.1 FKBP-type peptidyl prolyl cis-trans isomerase /Apo-metallochaperone SlyD [Nitrosomonas cryotolerans]SIN92869.1 FKBP-type peptidyl prolyl cis-trans isomerase /Apo-metallochaperone SlyD [Nitrosomonas cryotolerans ATCC 49181]
MSIEKNDVVSISYELSDASGNIVEKPDTPISYLHGGYGGIFPMVEEALHNMEVGYACSISMEPENTFGEYDSELVRVEPRSAFPENVAVGMQFEGGAEGSDDILIYTVTNIAEDKVIVDGNHPLAGMTLNFACTVTAVRPATEEELSHQHAHGPHGHEH